MFTGNIFAQIKVLSPTDNVQMIKRTDDMPAHVSIDTEAIMQAKIESLEAKVAELEAHYADLFQKYQGLDAAIKSTEAKRYDLGIKVAGIELNMNGQFNNMAQVTCGYLSQLIQNFNMTTCIDYMFTTTP
jgi:transposase-like protein